MPITLNIRQDYNLIILTHRGEIPNDEFLDFYKKFFQENIFNPSMNLLVDLRETDSSPRNAEVLHKLAGIVRESLKEINKWPRIAVVAPKALTFGFARMYETLASTVKWEFSAFHSLKEALNWLGLSVDSLQLPEKKS